MFDHVVGKERKDAVREGGWEKFCGGACAGACAEVMRATTNFSSPPSELAKITKLQVGNVMGRHLACVTQLLCDKCHRCFSADRGHETDSDEDEDQ